MVHEGWLEQRQLRPPPRDNQPNDNEPEEVPPGTVGPNAYPGFGDVHVMYDAYKPPPQAQAWAGWPVEWLSPNWWGRVDTLTDVAWACLDLNSALLSTMPPYLVGASPSLSADWMSNPDPAKYATWDEFAKQLFWDYQLGEAFVVCTARYSTGWPARFHVIDPWLVNVEFDGAMRRRYSVGEVEIPAQDMLHLRYTSRTGDAHGHGPLEAGRARLVAAQLLQRYASNFLNAGAVPNAVLSHPDELTATQTQELQTQWVTMRAAGMGLPAVLSGGVTFDTVQLSPNDMGLVELAQLTESRIAVLLRVPPFLMGLPSGGDPMTYSNVSSLFDYYWRSGLKPRADQVMRALSMWALPRGTSVEVNRDEFVRPGPLERAQTWEILIRSNVMTPEEAREFERFGISQGATDVPIQEGVLG